MSDLPTNSQHLDIQDNDQYWASKTGLELAEAAAKRWKDFRSDLQVSFYYQRGRDTYCEYYGLTGQGYAHDDSRVGVGGEQGQLMQVRANRVQQYGRWQLALVVQTRPAFNPIPVNTSYQARASCTFVKKLLAYHMDRKGLAKAIVNMGEMSQIWSEGHLVVDFDPKAGPALDGSPGREQDPLNPTRTNVGDFKYQVLGLDDVAYDLHRRDSRHDWITTRTFVNKWDLIARYATPTGTESPEIQQEMLDLAEEIKAINPSVWTKDEMMSWNSAQWNREHLKGKTDLIPIYTTYHRKSEAMPQGLVCQWLSADCFLWQAPLPISRVPVYTLHPSDIFNTPFGDSPIQHLAGLSQIRNRLLSAVCSGVSATSMPVLVMDPQDDMTPSHVQNLAVLYAKRLPNGELPMPATVDLSPKNLGANLEVIKLLDTEMESFSAINSVVKGQPQENIESGSFGALVANQALTYQSNFTSAMSEAIGEIGDIHLELYKVFGDKTFEAELAGPGRSYQVEQFNKNTLSGCAAVTVQQGNPASRSPSFQLSIAQMLMGRPDAPIRTADLVTFLVSGSYDALLDPTNDMELCIEEENELLLQGQEVQALLADPHWVHVPKHMAKFSSPEVRSNPQLAQAFTQHLQSHFQLDGQMPANVRQLLGGPPTPMMPPPPPPPAPEVQAAYQATVANASNPQSPLQSKDAETVWKVAGAPHPNPPPPPVQAPNPPGSPPNGMPHMPKPAKDPRTGQAPNTLPK